MHSKPRAACHELLRYLRWCGAILGFMVLAGCASTVGSEVTVFQEWPEGTVERSFRLVRTAGQDESLAHATFERVVRAELLAAGFAETPDPRLEIRFDYAVRDGVVRRPGYYGGPYFSPFFSFGYGGPHSFFGFSAPLSWWAWDRDERYYERRFSLTMRDLRAQPPRSVYEATAINAGTSPELVSVLPYLVRAALDDFPARSGSTRWVEVPQQPAKAPAD